MNNLKILRQEAGFTQSDVAEILGISTRAYQYKEWGLNQLKQKEMDILCQIYYLRTYNELYEKNNENNENNYSPF